MSAATTTGARAERLKKATLDAARAFGDPARRSDYLELYDDNAAIYYTPQGTIKGIEAIKQYYSGFWAAFPDARLELENVMAEGDRVACTFTVTGTHTGSAFNGIPAAGKKIAVTGASVLRFLDNGKCIERWHGADTLPLLQQLGAMPATPH
ncbi:ester cyclase [Nitrososphaera sp.]|uniref:ester cyclase n=1 Tax=Nitrososphaera sp. TaxID=1971748 RepID=UPI00307D9DA8